MYNIIKNEIKSGRKMTEVKRLTDIAMNAGAITEAQYNELRREAEAAANPDENQPELRAMVIALEARVKALEEKAGTSAAPEQPEEGAEASAYPAWEPWNGYEYKYNGGEIVTHKGEIWKNNLEGKPNTWEPGTVGTETLWIKYTPA